MYIDQDLETTPLEIKTNRIKGSNEVVYVGFYSAQEEEVGGVSLYFRSPAQYTVWFCTSNYNDLPSTLPTITEKIWQITLTRTSDVRLIIHCNGVEVVNILMSFCAQSAWSNYWTMDVEKIWFHPSDTAADYYRAEPGD